MPQYLEVSFMPGCIPDKIEEHLNLNLTIGHPTDIGVKPRPHKVPIAKAVARIMIVARDRLQGHRATPEWLFTSNM